MQQRNFKFFYMLWKEGKIVFTNLTHRSPKKTVLSFHCVFVANGPSLLREGQSCLNRETLRFLDVVERKGKSCSRT